MKQLQRNFTTPEQSKRLLELGLPADSADCYYDQYQILNFRTELDYGYDFFELNFRFIPCWSVGRLIEILEITLGTPWSDHEELGKSTLIERVLRDFKDVVKYKEIFKDSRIDFSKLNDYETTK